jgi:hypothetical protein
MSIFHYYFNKCDPQFHHSLHVVQSTAAIVEFINQNSNAFQLFSAKIYYTARYWTSHIELWMRDTQALPPAYKNGIPLTDMYYCKYLRPQISDFNAVFSVKCVILPSLIWYQTRWCSWKIAGSRPPWNLKFFTITLTNVTLSFITRCTSYSQQQLLLSS